MMMQRLDKIISQRSAYSRSEIKKMIKRGYVMVDGSVCKECDEKFDEDKKIKILDECLGPRYLYLMMNKPEGVICATKDKYERTVIDILPPKYRNRGILPAGRLDKDTTGMLILTNDGRFLHNIMSPNKKIVKYYIAKTDKYLTDGQIQMFGDGIVFRDGTKCKSAVAENIITGDGCNVGVRVSEGKYHQVKKMMAVCGVSVLKLTRISIGDLELDVDLNKGECRELSNLEINKLMTGSFD